MTGETPSLPDFSTSLPMTLLRARECVIAYSRPKLREHDLTEQQWRVLRALAEHERMEISELAEHCFILMPSLSRILQNLETRRLIVRRAVKSDHRRVAVALSRSGRRLFEVMIGRIEDCYREIAERFGADRLAELQAMLDTLITSTRQP